jgi:cell division protein YceG involved in septum cleavage
MDGLPGIKNKLLNADPTVIYANDTVQLDALDFSLWKDYRFWTTPEIALRNVPLPESLMGYQTYTQPGLIPGPIATPTLASIDAALHPDTADKYLYFVAIPDGGGKHAFAKTAKQHQANLKKYGYIK